MTLNYSRRTFIKRTIQATVTIASLGAGSCFYANQIEPTRLQINQISFKSPKITTNLNNLKIIQFSDTHLGFQYSLQQLEKIITTINDYEPDLICFTGDLIDDPNSFTNINPVINELKRLKAPLGKFAIYGNHDHGGYGTKLYKKIMDAANFNILMNSSEIIVKDTCSFYLLGIDDAILGKPNFDKLLTNVPEQSLKILLSHAPDLADYAAKKKIDFQLSGHSHGGQIKLPLFGAIVKPPFAEKYIEGKYTVKADHELTLYVNRGLGTTRLPFRFLSRPELTIITLVAT